MAEKAKRAEYPEPGPDNARRFESLMGKVLSVPRAELERREAEYRDRRPPTKRAPAKPKSA